MYSKLDDALLDHRKVFEAGEKIGRNGPAVVIGFFAACLMYSNKHLTDGFISLAVLRKMPHVDKPESVAGFMADVRLLDKVEGGYKIHDFHDHNFRAESVLKKRAADRERKRGNGAVS